MRNAFRRLVLPVLVLVGAGAGCATRPLAQTLTQFPIPTSDSYPLGITAGPDGALWFTESGVGYFDKIGRISTTGVITEFPVPTAGGDAWDIAAGSDGALWFTEANGKNIGRITTAGAITEFPIPSDNEPFGITAGPDGALWFTETGGSLVGRITTAGAFTEFPVPTAGSGPMYITAGPDGALWFTEVNASKIGRITTAGAVTEFPIPTAPSNPEGITMGPDGALWFTEELTGKIGRITTAGVVTEFPISSPGNPFGITTGPDGALWFAGYGANYIGRFANGVFAQFPIQTTGANSYPIGIAAGPDDAVWFTEYFGNNIGRLGATLAPSPASGNAPLLVSFKATGLPPAASYTIQFGDGASLTYAPNPMPEYLCGRSPVSCVNPTASFSASHTYTVAGAYTATLLGSNNKTLSVTTIGINPSSTEYNRIYPSSHVDPVEVFPTTQGVPEHF
jgi:virginiamycin B lyase